MYVHFAPPAQCLRCTAVESRRVKSDSEAFGWPPAAISDIRMSFPSPVGETAFHASAPRPLKTTGARRAGTDCFYLHLKGVLREP